MALQDDEEDRINFDERSEVVLAIYYFYLFVGRDKPSFRGRDRNAQYWLFKQLYHVLVQSSSSVLVLGWPLTAAHLTSAWQVPVPSWREWGGLSSCSFLL